MCIRVTQLWLDPSTVAGGCEITSRDADWFRNDSPVMQDGEANLQGRRRR